VARRHEKTITIEENAVGFGYQVRFFSSFRYHFKTAI
jgi:hypothetical protein